MLRVLLVDLQVPWGRLDPAVLLLQSDLADRSHQCPPSDLAGLLFRAPLANLGAPSGLLGLADQLVLSLQSDRCPLSLRSDLLALSDPLALPVPSDSRSTFPYHRSPESRPLRSLQLHRDSLSVSVSLSRRIPLCKQHCSHLGKMAMLRVLLVDLQIPWRLLDPAVLLLH